jgi:hypothetical protein
VDNRCIIMVFFFFWKFLLSALTLAHCFRYWVWLSVVYFLLAFGLTFVLYLPENAIILFFPSFYFVCSIFSLKFFFFQTRVFHLFFLSHS